MRQIVVGLLVGMLLIAIGLTALSAKPLLRARGNFWTELHFAGQWFDIHFTFDVHDRGEDDHGNLLMRIFDHEDGNLVAVGHSYGEMDVFVVGEWVLFNTPIRTSFYDEDYFLPLQLPTLLFQAFDGGDADQFKLLNIPLVISKGKVVVW